VLYFAYGSNMLTSRLRGRAPSARVAGRAELRRHALRIHKRARDGSAKCDAFFTGLETDRVFGVLFALDDGDWESLDRAEGRGNGYQRIEVEVVAEAPSPRTKAAQVYIAQPSHIDADLLPYTWYLDIVVAGAREHGLPTEYVAGIAAHPAMPAPP
jgi:gamma-glutamylcyclotransferase (GGCT)/AIG2-like uncharacterized protein YtfP